MTEESRNPQTQPQDHQWDVNPPTIRDLLSEGWRPDGHKGDDRPHELDEDECWCNPSAVRS